MANWVVFTSTDKPPAAAPINLDMVKFIVSGTASNTVSLDGKIVVGTVATLMLMLPHAIYPGVVSGPITST